MSDRSGGEFRSQIRLIGENFIFLQQTLTRTRNGPCRLRAGRSKRGTDTGQNTIDTRLAVACNISQHHAIAEIVFDLGGHQVTVGTSIGIAIAPDDIARAVIYALNQPENVTVNDLIISPTRQDW